MHRGLRRGTRTRGRGALRGASRAGGPPAGPAGLAGLARAARGRGGGQRPRLDRWVPHPAPARPGRHERRLSGVGRAARPARGAQDEPRLHGDRRAGAGALRARGAGRDAARAPRHRPPARRRRVGRPGVLHDGVRRRSHAGAARRGAACLLGPDGGAERPGRPRPARAVGRRSGSRSVPHPARRSPALAPDVDRDAVPLGAPGRGRAGARPSRGRAASGREALEHHRGPRRARAALRPRARAAAGPPRADALERLHRYAVLHLARAARRWRALRGSAQRRLLPRRHALRAPHVQAALRRQVHRAGVQEHRRSRSGPALAHRREHPAGPRDDLRHGDGEAPEGPLPGDAEPGGGPASLRRVPAGPRASARLGAPRRALRTAQARARRRRRSRAGHRRRLAAGAPAREPGHLPPARPGAGERGRRHSPRPAQRPGERVPGRPVPALARGERPRGDRDGA